jgi:transcriptional regulator with XRE-family HTH domain
MSLRILEICKQKGITQKELAAKIGMSAVGLSKAINGNPTIQTVNKIADALGVNVWDLFVQNDYLKCPKCTGIGFSIKKTRLSSEFSLRCNGCGYVISNDMENDVLEKIAYMSGFKRVSVK